MDQPSFYSLTPAAHSKPALHYKCQKRHIQFQPLCVKERPLHTKPVYRIVGGTATEPCQLRRVQDVPSKEYDFHKSQLGFKQRVPDLFRMRNQLSYASLGDKPYKVVESSPEFYKGGGLMAGSTNVFRQPHQNRLCSYDFATIGSYEATNPARTRWAERRQHDAKHEDYEAVHALSQWEQTTLNEVHPGLPAYDSSDDEP